MLRFLVPTMSCGGCAKGVTRAIHIVDPNAKVEVNLGARVISVVSHADEGRLLASLSKAGYPAELSKSA